MKISLYIKLLILLFIVALPLVFIWSEYQRFMTTEITVTPETELFVIQPGDNLSRVSQRLYQQGLSPTPSVYLDAYGRLQGNANQIKAGEYEIKRGTILPDLLQQFIDGKVKQYAFTIIEGMTAQQILAKLREHPKIKPSSTEPDLFAVMAALGGESKHAEGWFLPETYHFTAGTSDIDMLRRAYQKMQRYLLQAWENRAEDLPYETPYEALIMASIIEKETGVPDERDIIAGVFVRRMQIGMRLQTDPTVIYGMGDVFDGSIRRKDLQTDTPYNTYTRHGLPPTPIAMPSREAIDAALHPADGDYLYFVATGYDGRHTFSTNLEDHNRAVRAYRASRRQ